MTEDELVRKLIKARDKSYRAKAKIGDLENELTALRFGDYPTEPGWYEDAEGNIARLVITCHGPSWDDGWDNPSGEGGYPMPALPLTRLVPAQ